MHDGERASVCDLYEYRYMHTENITKPPFLK